MNDQAAVPMGPWRPTVALVRASLFALVLIAIALVWRRADLLVLAAPMAVVVAWSLLTRPVRPPTIDERIGNPTIREGAATTWRGDVVDGDGGADFVGAVLADATMFERIPAGGSVTAPVSDGGAQLAIGVRSVRWGVRPVERVHVVAASTWASFCSVLHTGAHPLTTLPLPAVFDADASSRPTDGLIGQHRSTRPGEGNEFAAVRPFAPGDRMRRINWIRSARGGELLVNATWADRDMHLALVVDAGDDFGVSDGIDGRASSLDLGVRAAGAIADHYAPRGERVSLRAFGTPVTFAVPPATGRTQLRRILDTLARIRVAQPDRGGYRVPARDPRLATGGQLTVMLSPLVSPEALDLAVALGRRGLPVVVVDTLPDHVVLDDDMYTSLAWRVRLLERRRELRIVREAGIPVITWRGPGSLDQVIRDIARRSSAASAVAR